jgi:hypothetical protein
MTLMMWWQTALFLSPNPQEHQAFFPHEENSTVLILQNVGMGVSGDRLMVSSTSCLKT